MTKTSLIVALGIIPKKIQYAGTVYSYAGIHQGGHLYQSCGVDYMRDSYLFKIFDTDTLHKLIKSKLIIIVERGA